MVSKRHRLALLVFALSVAVQTVARAGECQIVRGRLLNRPVTEGCSSPFFCAEGKLLGRLNGTFDQTGTGLAPAGAALEDPAVPPAVAFGSADIALDTKLCGGVLLLKDTFVINFAAPDPANSGDGFFSAVHTVDPQRSTGGCFGATGQLRVSGVSTPSGVDADYEGVICSEKMGGQ